MSEKPTVSVWIACYYAGEYIAEAIESVLSQRTEYAYEIVINDDCSGDNSWEVISEYVKKYPDIISAKRNESNLGLCANVLATKLRCKGQFIVNLSADDYWIDENKIQKQVDFLISHPNYVGVGSKVEIRYGRSGVASSSYPKEKHLGRDYTVSDYNNNVNLPSHGFMMRNIFQDQVNRPVVDKVYSLVDSIDDLFDPVLYLQFGKIFIMPDATCVYRVEPVKEGKHNFNSKNSPIVKASILIDGYNKMDAIQFEGVDLRKRYTVSMNVAILWGLAKGKMKEAKALYQTIPEKYRHPFYNSVAFHCLFFGVIKAGFHQVINRINRSKAIKELS